MSQPVYHHKPQGENTIAVIGFVLSLVGLFMGGSLSPIGALVSCFGLGKEHNRGFAIAGLIIGLIGTFAMLAWVLVVLAMLGVIASIGVGVATAIKPIADTQEAFQEAHQLVAEQGDSRMDDESLNLLLGDREIADGWGNPIRIESNDHGYTLRSGGADGKFDTPDDMTSEDWQAHNVEVGPAYSDDAPFAEPAEATPCFE